MSTYILIFVIFVAIAGAILLYLKIGNSGAIPSIGSFTSLFGKSRLHGPATELQGTIRELAAKPDVVWPEIMESLNPTNERAIEQLLSQVRNGNQFNPRVGAGELRVGFKDAIKKNPKATVQDALNESVNSGNKIKRAGD